jgi:hypothetical protein
MKSKKKVFDRNVDDVVVLDPVLTGERVHSFPGALAKRISRAYNMSVRI